jgi:hypothetical protein
MGTHCMTKGHDGEPIVANVYRHSDGYESQHGVDLKRIITKALEDGTSDMGCLAASVVAGLKQGPRGIYLYPTDQLEMGVSYTYEITGQIGEGEGIRIRVTSAVHGVLYDGPISTYHPGGKR